MLTAPNPSKGFFTKELSVWNQDPNIDELRNSEYTLEEYEAENGVKV